MATTGKQASSQRRSRRRSGGFPPPSERQARVLWISITALAIAVFMVLLGLVLMGLAWAFKQLAVIIVPLAVAAIMAYLLDPIVDFLERSASPYRFLQFSRLKAIVYVFGGIVLIVGALAATIIPQLVTEAVDFGHRAQEYSQDVGNRVVTWVEGATWLQEAWNTETRDLVKERITETLPKVASWLSARAGQLASLPNYLLGIALVPVFVFFFLLQKNPIVQSWRDYLPIQDPTWKREIVFVVNSINESMIAFFRGQVLVAICLGIMLTVGYLVLGLKYPILLGALAAIFSIVPYLGVVLGIIPALMMAVIAPDYSWLPGWWLPILVGILFIGAQTAEGLFISPKIIGDRVGMHPMTIIIAVLVGTTLMGGIVGGVLAIPLTAALRAIMFRYVWTHSPSSKQQPPSRQRSRRRRNTKRATKATA